jgi:hypothetical protein
MLRLNRTECGQLYLLFGWGHLLGPRWSAFPTVPLPLGYFP